jgi:hypothetical protein
MTINISSESLHLLVSSALADFLVYLEQYPTPIIIGDNYHYQRLLDAYKKWAESRNLAIDPINIQYWKSLCSQKIFESKSC